MPSMIFSSLAPAIPTKVFDTFWHFAAERQNIFFRRLAGKPAPWSDDPIFSRYKFTNAYRASDRVSQFLIRHVIYKGEQNPEEIFFRTILFKLFNKIDTWKLLLKTFQNVSHSDYSYKYYDRVLCEALRKGLRIYSAAYIMPSGHHLFRASRKHQAHLRLLEQMMRDEVFHRIMETRRMSEAFSLLRSYPMIGDFLAYQFVTDVNYSIMLDFSEMEYVIPGPGCRDGIHKCFRSLGGLSETDIVKLISDRQEEEFARRGLIFQSLGGRRLQLIDCQNLFCEVGKYSRIKHPDISGLSGRKRIKQKFRASSELIDYWYPPKWGINGKIYPRG